jgi:hypothetical protein
MHRRTFIGLGVCAIAGVATRASTLAQAGWTELIDGKTLSGWNRLGEANWRVEDSVIIADGGKGGYLVTPANYRDFELRAEIWVDEKANSGIFFRCSDPNKITATNAYEANIFDTRSDPSYGTGAIVNVAKVDPMPKAGGKWNTMEISAKVDRLSFVFNGIRTVDNVQDNKYADGPIALQYGTGIVKFRNVRVRRV